MLSGILLFLIVALIIGVIVRVIDMPAEFKKIVYIILGVAVLIRVAYWAFGNSGAF